MDLHYQARRMRVLAGVRNELGGNERRVECMTRVDVTGAGIVECQLHLSLPGERTDHSANVSQEIAEVYSVAVLRQRQRLVKSRRHLEARADIVEQHANLIRGEGFAALADGTAL